MVECYQILEGLSNLRPKVVQELLEKCNSIKVKHLFLFMASKANHQWLDYVDQTRNELETALTNITDSLERIRERIKKSIPEASVNKYALEGNDIKLLVQSKKAQIKIEVNTITRGHLHPARKESISLPSGQKTL
jgi:hypothetical protein